MSTFHRFYQWLNDIIHFNEYAVVRIPADIRQDLGAAALLMALCHSSIRSPISTLLSCTDATVSTGGTVVCRVGHRLSESLYRMCEYRGARVIFTRRQDHDPNMDVLPPEDPIAAEIVKAIPWKLYSKKSFPQVSHINLQEARGLVDYARLRSRRTLLAERLVNGTDSSVFLGSWAKGRSPSIQLNGIYRRGKLWILVGDKSLDNFKLESADNPADDPTRNRKVRPPRCPADWLEPLFVPEADDHQRTPLTGLVGMELFSGPGGLTRALVRTGVRMSRGFECYLPGGHYLADFDLDNPEVRDEIISLIQSRLVCYIHFGLPCTSWGAANQLNNGTRSPSSPDGNCPLEREQHGNRQAQYTVDLIFELVSSGGIFTLEHPEPSFVLQSTPFQELQNKVCWHHARIDMCQYGLQLPGSRPGVFCRKRSSLIGNFPEVLKLEQRCPGISPDHYHETAWGHRVVNGQRMQLSKSAGSYAPRFCEALASSVRAALLRLRPSKDWLL